jgi:hypothetical protein
MVDEPWVEPHPSIDPQECWGNRKKALELPAKHFHNQCIYQYLPTPADATGNASLITGFCLCNNNSNNNSINNSINNNNNDNNNDNDNDTTQQHITKEHTTTQNTTMT